MNKAYHFLMFLTGAVALLFAPKLASGQALPASEKMHLLAVQSPKTCSAIKVGFGADNTQSLGDTGGGEITIDHLKATLEATKECQVTQLAIATIQDSSAIVPLLRLTVHKMEEVNTDGLSMREIRKAKQERRSAQIKQQAAIESFLAQAEKRLERSRKSRRSDVHNAIAKLNRFFNETSPHHHEQSILIVSSDLIDSAHLGSFEPPEADRTFLAIGAADPPEVWLEHGPHIFESIDALLHTLTSIYGGQ